MSADVSIEVVSRLTYVRHRIGYWMWPSGALAVVLFALLVARGSLDSVAELAVLAVIGLITIGFVILSRREQRARLSKWTVCMVSLPRRARQMLEVRTRPRWAEAWVTRYHAILLDPDRGLVFAVGQTGVAESIPLRERRVATRVRCLGDGRVLSVGLSSTDGSCWLRAEGRLPSV